MLVDLNVIDHIWDIRGRNIILYGASSGGVNVYQTFQKAGISILGFSDGNSDKWGTEFCGKPVISREELKQYSLDKEMDIIIVISSCYAKEIYKDLVNDQIDCDICSSFSALWGLWFAMQKEDDVPEWAQGYWREKKLFQTVSNVSSNNLSSSISGLSPITLNQLLFEECPYIAYNPAKVGSSSICIELVEKGVKNVIHLHDIELFFSREHSASKEEKDLILNAIRNKENVKIITGVRDPIARDISLVFSEMGDGAKYMEGLNASCNFLKYINTEILEQTTLVEKKDGYFAWLGWIKQNAKYGTMFDWFDIEIKRFFGVDIYDYPFDKEKGYIVIKKGNIEVFLYRMENLWDLEKELKEFTGVPDFTIQHKNDSAEKSYYLTYECVKDELKLKKEYIDFYYKNNPRMKHFYTDEEIANFRKKWER